MKGCIVEHDYCETFRDARFGERVEIGRYLSLIARAVEFSNFELFTFSVQREGADQIEAAFRAPAGGYLELLARTSSKLGVAHIEHQRKAALVEVLQG